MKKGFVLSFIFVLIISTLAFATQSQIETLVNDQKVAFDVPPSIEKGTTLVPLRAIFEALGATVNFDKATNTIVATKGDSTTKLVLGDTKGYVNGVVNKLSVPAKTTQGRTLVPLRFVSEALGAVVNWNEITRTITINLNGNQPQATELFKVNRVVDGDTIEVNYNGKSEKVRLIGVDTPETKHPTIGIEPYGKEASAFSTSQLEGKQVKLEFDVEKRDRYDRLLAYVWVGEKFFNAELVKQGYAQVATFPPNVKYVDLFVKLQREARENNVGLWGLEQNSGTVTPTPTTTPTKPATDGVYVGSVKSDKYHYPDCTWAKKITEENKISFTNKDDAHKQGYLPCSVCKP